MTRPFRQGAVAVAVVAIAAAIGAGLWRYVSTDAAVPAPSQLVASKRVTLPRVVLDDRSSTELGAMMSADPAMADGVIFLLVAAQTGKCHVTQAHDLPRMAVVAGLPVLAIGSGNDARAATTRQAVAGTIHAIVARAPCAPYDVQIGSFGQRIDPDRYAAAFPDAYFSPDLTAVPDEYKGVPLGDRARDQCNRVAYAVVPLDEARPWQCAGMRAAARTHIRQLCREKSPEEAARAIRASTDALPSSCQ